jgi:hypothetical protein
LSEFGYWTSIHQPATSTRFEPLSVLSLISLNQTTFIQQVSIADRSSEAILNLHFLQGTSAQWPGILESLQIRNVIERLVVAVNADESMNTTFQPNCETSNTPTHHRGRHLPK